MNYLIIFSHPKALSCQGDPVLRAILGSQHTPPMWPPLQAAPCSSGKIPSHVRGSLSELPVLLQQPIRPHCSQANPLWPS